MNGPHPEYVSSSVISLALKEDSEARLTNIKFRGNNFLGTKAIVV